MNNLAVNDEKKNGYKKTSVGYIPTEWEIKKLKDVVRFLDGKRKPIKASERAKIQGKYPYYGASGIIDYVDDYIFDDELILLGEDGANILNRSSPLAFKVTGKCWVNNHAHVLKPKKNAVLGFVKEYLESIRYEKYNTSTAQPKLNKSVCKGIPVPVPPFKEQEKISEFLSTWDEAISKTEKLIKAKKRYKKGLMQRLLSGTIRFPEFVKSEEVRKTRFGIYPKDWKYVKIQKVATQVKGKVGDETEGYTVMSCTKHDGLVSSLEYFDRQVFSKDISNYKVVEKGEFAYATNHVEEGSIGYNNWCEKGAISPMYTVFKADQDKIDNEYLYAIIKTETYRRIFEIFTNGTVNRRGSLRWKDFKKIKVPIPALEEQKAISKVIKKAEQEIQLHEKKLVSYQKQKKGLMQQLLTGKVRVK